MLIYGKLEKVYCSVTNSRPGYFFAKGHIKKTSNLPFISNLKILEGATKHDVLLFATSRYFR